MNTLDFTSDPINAIVGNWLRSKMRRLIRDNPDDGPMRGHWQYGPHGRAALNMKKQGAGLSITLLALFGRV